MIYNHARKTVWDRLEEPSICPDCRQPLIARRGEVVRGHWAHRSTGSRAKCPHEETAWHLAMKAAYLGFPGWEVEIPVHLVVGSPPYHRHVDYRADAMNVETGRIREFVHSLSPHYVTKHTDLLRAGYDVLWILDGAEFASLRARPCRNDGVRKLLKPRALQLCRRLKTPLVHYAGALWKEWRDNVWYKCTGDAAQAVIARMNSPLTTVETV